VRTRSPFSSLQKLSLRELRQEKDNGASPRQQIDCELLKLTVIKRDCTRMCQ
jgi:hypothetical protein